MSYLVQYIQSLENKRINSLLQGDFGTVEGMLSDTLLYGHSTGVIDDKYSLMAGLRSKTVQYQTITSLITKATPATQDVVIAMGEIAIRATVNGQEGNFGGPYMAVWCNIDGVWLLQALQATKAAENK